MTVMNANPAETVAVEVVAEEAEVKESRVTLPTVLAPTEQQLASFDECDRDLLLRALHEPVEYTDHELFQRPDVESILFGTCSVEAASRRPARRSSGDATMHRANDSGTLNSAEEIMLFQRFNLARMRQVHLLQKYAHRHMPTGKLRELLAWARRAIGAREQIARANLPLVLAMAKRTRLNGLDFNELISEGNFALLRSVDKFDCARGYKFSTYACRAILKSFSRVAIRTSRYRGRFPTEFDPTLEKSDFVDRKRDNVESDCVQELRDILSGNKAALNEIEQTVIRQRFALDDADPQAKPKTLEQVGELIGVTKERVRQIQNKALQKIRSILEEDYLAA